MEKRNTSKEKQSKILQGKTFELRDRRDIMKENIFTHEEGRRMCTQLEASHCLKEDIEGRQSLISFLLEIRFSIL